MEALPMWPEWTVAFLATAAAEGPHAIPVSAPIRAGDRTILLSLYRRRGSLARLRARPEVALLIVAEGVACTARGTARVVSEKIAGSPDYAAVEITVTDVDDHRSGVPDRIELAHRVGVLQSLVAMRRRCQVVGDVQGEASRAAREWR